MWRVEGWSFASSAETGRSLERKPRPPKAAAPPTAVPRNRRRLLRMVHLCIGKKEALYPGEVFG
jgi:hypothetical protein